ncbi:MAG: BspA family leucine-rich repeat surface protein [Corynebacterium sp.]|nr:BspA family leucine-rich repeat surface protein [Corynebacterium sp.]
MRKFTAALITGLALATPVAMASTMVTAPIVHAEVVSKDFTVDGGVITMRFDSQSKLITVSGTGVFEEDLVSQFLKELITTDETEDYVLRFINEKNAIKLPEYADDIFNSRPLETEFSTRFRGTVEGLENVAISAVRSLEYTFSALAGVKGIEHWDTSKITNFNSAFTYYRGDADLSGWDVSSGTDFASMFSAAPSINPKVTGWDMSKAEDISYMFNGATSAKLDLSGWKFSPTVNKEGWLDNSGVTYDPNKPATTEPEKQQPPVEEKPVKEEPVKEQPAEPNKNTEEKKTEPSPAPQEQKPKGYPWLIIAIVLGIIGLVSAGAMAVGMPR